MTFIIDGRKIAADLCSELTSKVSLLKQPPYLVAIIVGDDPASHVYVKRKETAAKRVGIRSKIISLPSDTTEDELLSHIWSLNADPGVHGILVQLPLPKSIRTEIIIEEIDPNKDVDGFHPTNVGYLASGNARYAPCTPTGIMKLLDNAGAVLPGASALMVGCSAIVGRPTALMLNQADATVTIAHKLTRNLPELCSKSDIIVVAAGCPNLIRGNFIQRDAIIIDVGINRMANGSLVGDVAFDECIGIAKAITPVPGGVGPMTIACLLENTFMAATRKEI